MDSHRAGISPRLPIHTGVRIFIPYDPCDSFTYCFLIPVLEPHADIDFASPDGPNPPIDEGSVKVRPHPYCIPNITSAYRTSDDARSSSNKPIDPMIDPPYPTDIS